MKIAFVGKGGSGKTTLSSLLVRHLAAAGRPVLAVDADINQHLATTLGLSEEQAAALPSMGAHLTQIKEYLRGDNPRITDAASMIKTTPPGRGSRLLRLTEQNPVFELCARPLPLAGSAGAPRTPRPPGMPGIPGTPAVHSRADAGVPDGAPGRARIMATGPFTEGDLGVACYHSKVGALELCLNHLVDGPGEYLVADMTAGADAFASGLFTRFDLTFLVAEPTWQGISVFRQYERYARDFDVDLRVVGNKVEDREDLEFLHGEVGSRLLTAFGSSAWVRRQQRGRGQRFAELEPENRRALRVLHDAVDGSHQRRDWARYTRQMVHFHLRNAAAWGSARAGADLAGQVDPEFVLGESPAAVPS